MVSQAFNELWKDSHEDFLLTNGFASRHTFTMSQPIDKTVNGLSALIVAIVCIGVVIGLIRLVILSWDYIFVLVALLVAAALVYFYVIRTRSSMQ